MGSIVQLPNNTNTFSIVAVGQLPARIQKYWIVRSKKYKLSFFVRTDQTFILKSTRGSEPRAQLRDESLRDGTAGGRRRGGLLLGAI